MENENRISLNEQNPFPPIRATRAAAVEKSPIRRYIIVVKNRKPPKVRYTNKTTVKMP